MKKIFCDKCKKEITEDARYIVGTSKSEPNSEGGCPPRDWLMIKEICKDCQTELEQMFIHQERRCRGMTNSERIKNMSDEELSKLLVMYNQYEEDCIVDALSKGKRKCGDGTCEECIKKFLQEEVKE